MDWLSHNWLHIINFALSNFALSMFVVAAFFMLLHSIVTWGRVSQYEIVYRWTTFFAVGMTGLYYFSLDIFFPARSAEILGWSVSPFQYSVAMADLGFAFVAIASFNASFGFRLATVLANTCWLWGNASNHFYQISIAKNYIYGFGGSNSWFWMDLLLPLILVLCVSKQSLVLE